jgi:hypothetical protein
MDLIWFHYFSSILLFLNIQKVFSFFLKMIHSWQQESIIYFDYFSYLLLHLKQTYLYYSIRLNQIFLLLKHLYFLIFLVYCFYFFLIFSFTSSTFSLKLSVPINLILLIHSLTDYLFLLKNQMLYFIRCLNLNSLRLFCFQFFT